MYCLIRESSLGKRVVRRRLSLLRARLLAWHANLGLNRPVYYIQAEDK